MTNQALIYRPGAALGGHEYEARRRGDRVAIYHRPPRAARFRLAGTLSASQWAAWMADNAHDLSNPKRISRLADSLGAA